MGGDLFKTERGNMMIRFAGESRWISEEEFNRGRGWKHNISRLMDEGAYPGLEAAGKIAGFLDLGLSPPADLAAAAEAARGLRYPDYLFHEKTRLELLRAAYPQEARYSMLLARHIRGWYVPESRILPLGDNRDNSRDGRFFGPVRASKILGKGSVIYWSWPRFDRIGPIR
jgi:signal peptidase I